MALLRFLNYLLSSVIRHLWTLFLFTKSDIKTTVIPVTSLAVASAPLHDVSHVPHIVFWIWFHLLQFDVANQIMNPEEDKHNKPYRPIPAKRITWHNAVILRWVLVPACWMLSSCYSIETVYASMALCIFTCGYNEIGFANGHWAGKNILAALCLWAFEVGASLIAGSNRHALDNISWQSVSSSACIFATTMHAQDFKDIDGDRVVGRKTLPIVAPTIARPTLMLVVLAWSVGLSMLWRLSITISLAFNVVGLAVGIRYCVSNSIKADQHNYYFYNVWVAVAHALPAYFRFVSRAQTL